MLKSIVRRLYSRNVHIVREGIFLFVSNNVGLVLASRFLQDFRACIFDRLLRLRKVLSWLVDHLCIGICWRRWLNLLRLTWRLVLPKVYNILDRPYYLLILHDDIIFLHEYVLLIRIKTTPWLKASFFCPLYKFELVFSYTKADAILLIIKFFKLSQLLCLCCSESLFLLF